MHQLAAGLDFPSSMNSTAWGFLAGDSAVAGGVAGDLFCSFLLVPAFALAGLACARASFGEVVLGLPPHGEPQL